jgi:hypothetical protein
MSYRVGRGSGVEAKPFVQMKPEGLPWMVVTFGCGVVQLGIADASTIAHGFHSK